jgi:hypothetical protein
MVVKSASKKKLMDIGFSEVMAHFLADDMKWNEWKELPLKGKNSGFKKQFYKRMKQGRKAVRNQEGRITAVREGNHATDSHIMNVALFNEEVSQITYNMMHSLPILTPDAKFPHITSQGLFNWVSFEGEPYQKQQRVAYEQALGLFNMARYTKTLDKRRRKGEVAYEPDAYQETYEDWLKRNKNYKPESPYAWGGRKSLPYDYRHTPTQKGNPYSKWTMENEDHYRTKSWTSTPTFDWNTPQMKKQRDKYAKMYQEYSESASAA